MENPLTQSKAYRVIAKAIADHDRAMAARICGISLEKRIEQALAQTGFLTEAAQELDTNER